LVLRARRGNLLAVCTSVLSLVHFICFVLSVGWKKREEYGMCGIVS